jgi:DNA-binding IclR family transcriptional regulator
MADDQDDVEAASDSGAAPTPPSISYRVATLLELVGFREGGIGPREAARETGIDRSAVSRIFRQLETVGWVEQADDRGTYSAGPRMFAVAAAVRQRDSLWRAASPFLQALAAEHDETAYVSVLEDERVVFKEKIDSTQRIRYVVDLNTPYPLTTGAAGRAILSALPEEVAERAIRRGLVPYTPSSITDPVAYRRQLSQDRERGYAYSASGWVARGAGVASPFFNAAGQCRGALTISAPIDRLSPEAAPSIGASVLRAANGLSHRLGWDGSWGPT